MNINLLERVGKYIRILIQHIKYAFVYQKNLVIAGALFFVFVTLLSFVAPPRNFNPQSYVLIEQGATLSSISALLKEEGYIKYRQFFEIFVILFGKQKGVKAEEYFLERKITAIELAWRMVQGDTRVVPVPVTFFEGMTIEEMSSQLEIAFADFDTELFLRLAKGKEGYLFPDTYYFKRKVTPSEVIEVMERTFIVRTEELMTLFEESGRSIDELVIMASIIEKEAYRDKTEQRTIAGILWKRLSIDMPLQVDATLRYVTGKGSAQLTNEDLQTDFAFNTYTRKGLPPAPIGNPGLNTLRAAADPIETDYLFYLHGKDGQVRYARTHEGHLQNIRNYLR
jgi:UPF0755 protein